MEVWYDFITTIMFLNKFYYLINLSVASSIRSNVRIRPTRTEQTLTKWVRIVRSIANKYSQSDVVAYIVKNIRH